jgi:hypothetical protein
MGKWDLVGRPRRRWEDNTKMELEEIIYAKCIQNFNKKI